MEDLIYTMVLSDGTTIENLRKNGDNYISASKLTADMFEGKLSEVTVKTPENEVLWKIWILSRLLKWMENTGLYYVSSQLWNWLWLKCLLILTS